MLFISILDTVYELTDLPSMSRNETVIINETVSAVSLDKLWASTVSIS